MKGKSCGCSKGQVWREVGLGDGVGFQLVLVISVQVGRS